MSAGGSGTSKRRQFTLDEKIIIIKNVEGGRKKRDAADEYGIGASTLSTFLKTRNRFRRK